MSKNRLNKKIPEFEFSFNDISFCNDNKLKPFIEAFVQEPENVGQQSLGTIFGIFEVSDFSEDSSYITNYLISVIKKEYFSKPKRGAIESFEAALHKANLALSKLAEHGNVAWIGKINILCAVLEKYNLHLAQTGSCHAFLLRDRGLTDIGENLSSPEDRLNPLKTFTDISSGKIKEADKIILSTDGIFDIFSPEEIKKSANRFSESNFVRFMHTALINELASAAVLIVDIKHKEEKTTEKTPVVSEEGFNAFSSSTFAKATPKKPLADNLKEEIEKELKKSSQEIEDVKPGHIYIKEAEDLPKDESSFWTDFFSSLKSLPEKIKFRQITDSPILNEMPEKSEMHEYKQELKFKEPLKNIGEKAKDLSLKSFSITKDALKKAWLFIKRVSGKTVSLLVELYKKVSAPKTSVSPEIISPNQNIYVNSWKEKIKTSFLPSFSRIKNIFAKFSYEQKLYAIIVLFLIFVVPYFGVKIERKIAERRAAIIAQNTPKEIIPLEQDKNVVRLSDINSLYQSENEFSKIINLNGKMFFIGSSEIFDLEKNQSFPFSSEIGFIKDSTGMDDLNLILLITEDKKVFSFSPTSKKFQPSLIEIPAEADLTASGTYLTYLYLLDKQSGQIYRYPRAEGGFGAKTNWLKDKLDLSGFSEMDINENIFLAGSNEIIKLFKGKKQDFTVEETTTPIIYNEVYVAKNSSEIYILDKANSRVIHLDQDGNILSQFYNEKIGEASSFSVNEENNTIYFSAEKDVYSFVF